MSEGLRVRLRLTIVGTMKGVSGVRWFEESELPSDPHEFISFLGRELACALASKDRNREVLGVGVSLWGIPEAVATVVAKKAPPTPELADLWAQDYTWKAFNVTIIGGEGSNGG